MTLRLAPYNDAMRLGQGFNSYTHELCVDGAVKVVQRNSRAQESTNPSQVVSYSARLVEKLSDVVESLNVSYSAVIKKGTIEISGNTSTIDETTFKTSDLNAVVAVKVVNQTISIEDESEFAPISENFVVESNRFNEVYGDSYISGFIEGGDFTGIVSVKLNSTSTTSKKDKLNGIKTALNANGKTESKDFFLGPSEDSSRSEMSTALEETQTTISINWMGGGQIKEPSTPWDIDALYAAAAAFPAAVAKCPQRTWAILTPYKANRSFVKWCTQSPLKVLQYDLIASYTAELFDSFMDYKVLLKEVQNIINNRGDYRQKPGRTDGIDMNIETLLSVRVALRDEQTKIVEAIDILSQSPDALKRKDAWATENKAPAVKGIIEKALGTDKEWKPKDENSKGTKTGGTTPSSATVIKDETAEDVQSDGDGAVLVAKNVYLSSSVPQVEDKPQPTTTSSAAANFNFDTLIPPELWEDMLPEYVGSGRSAPSVVHPNDPQNKLSNPLIPPPDILPSVGHPGQPQNLLSNPLISTPSKPPGSGVIVSRSYDEMERGIQVAEKQSKEAEKKASDAEEKERDAKRLAEQTQRTLDRANDRIKDLEKWNLDLKERKEALEKSDGDKKTQLESKQTELNSKNHDLETTKALVVNGMNDSDIVIFSITWGSGCYYSLGSGATSDLAEKTKNLMRRNEEFTVTSQFFTPTDPDPGLVKFGCIVYRYNRTEHGHGREIRVTTFKEATKVKFQAYS